MQSRRKETIPPRRRSWDSWHTTYNSIIDATIFIAFRGILWLWTCPRCGPWSHFPCKRGFPCGCALLESVTPSLDIQQMTQHAMSCGMCVYICVSFSESPHCVSRSLYIVADNVYVAFRCLVFRWQISYFFNHSPNHWTDCCVRGWNLNHMHGLVWSLHNRCG